MTSKKIQLNSILDYYPCGTYKLTKNGEETICKLYNNLSQVGASNKQLEQLYKKGYINNDTKNETNISVEHFMNMKESNNNYIILMLFLILILIVIV